MLVVPSSHLICQTVRVAAYLLAGLLLLAFPQSHSADSAFSFRTEILPILTKAGCNAGACHGAAVGQGGFNLSLLGYDPEEDFDRITRQLEGRRIDIKEPAASLLLRKGSNQTEHEGGRRLPRDSSDYEIVRKWIASGAIYGDRHLAVQSIEVAPAESLLERPTDSLQPTVTATLTDGSTRDVSSLSLYSSNDDAVAEVSKFGKISATGQGASSIMVRYGGQVAAARIAIPFSDKGGRLVSFTPKNFIDNYIVKELEKLRLPISGPSHDAEFLRRITLDLTGRLPELETARRFALGTNSSEWRQQVITDLLNSSAFVDFWTMRLAELLLISGKQGEAGARAYQEWLRKQVASNRPLDQVVRSLLVGSGKTTEVGPANFYTVAKDPRDIGEHVSRMFLGVQLACARCHTHPSDRWTQEDYHRFAAFFAQLNQDGDAIKVTTRGEVEHPKTGLPVTPLALGEAQQPAIKGDRREAVASWLTHPGNPFFAKSFVNRVWKHLLGRGLVEPVDDLRPTNPSTHPALLEELAAHFVSSGYDLRTLIMTIVSSEAYQLTSRASGINHKDDRFYSHAYRKPLSAQVFVDAVSQVTGTHETFAGYEEGTRAVQLIGTRQESYALDVLGRCSREISCETVGTMGGGLAQALHLMNGSTINEKLDGPIVNKLSERQTPTPAIIEELYLRALTRRPAEAEMKEWATLVDKAENRKEAVQDLLWALLNSREFAFNH